MNLEPFGWALGISDILAYRDCPERMAWGMRRHLGDEAPEATNEGNAYGSAIHEAIHEVEMGATRELAIERALAQYGRWLTPEHIALLNDDLDLYGVRHPDPKEWELVASERDMRVPLFVHAGQQIYFRFKLDALFRSREHRDVFMLRDYKSSAHRKTAAEVHADPQQWSYNFGVHELFPECRLLLQQYDQLKFGVEKTTKNAQQRAEMKQWLVSNVKTILADDTMDPSINSWCSWCPMLVTCKETRRASSFWRGHLAVVAPLRKDGRKIRVEFMEDIEDLETMISVELPKMQQVRKHIEKVESELKAVVQEMAVEDRARLGWRLQDRKSNTITPDGLRELHALLGDSFYELVNLPISRLEDMVGKPQKNGPMPRELAIASEWSVEGVASSTIVPLK